MTTKPPSEQMTTRQFHQWVKDMGYEQRSGSAHTLKIPYDPAVIAADLGVKQEYVYRCWRGIEKGKPHPPSAQVTRLCYALLALRMTRKALRDAMKKHPDCDTLLASILKKTETPAFKPPPPRYVRKTNGGKDVPE
jgi:hypothetical protein